MKNIRAVFFDMGGTIDTYGYTQEMRLEQTTGIHQLLSSVGIDLGLSMEKLYEVVTSGLARYHAWCVASLEELSPKQVWGDYILPDFSIDNKALESIAEDLACFIETRFYQRKMRPDIPTVLENIKNMGLKIGLISNVNSRGQVPANLSEYQIAHFFSSIVLSSEYGRRKPDPSIFHHAARLFKVPTSSCVMVGDRLVRDILGARRAGYGITVQIVHQERHGEPDNGPAPDYVIEEMTDLVEILNLEILHSASNVTCDYRDSKNIRALLFDAGDILYYRPERGKFLSEFFDKFGVSPSERTKQERYLVRQQAYRGEIDQEHYQKELLSLYGITQPELICLGLEAMQKDENNVQFFEGVRETLITLKEQGYLLGIITDTANPLHAKLAWFENGGFGHVWDSIISSVDVGVRKPDRKIYLAALEQLGVPVSQAVFIGHKPSELDGAKSIGFKTIAFNYDELASADYYVEEFRDILQVPLIGLEKASH